MTYEIALEEINKILSNTYNLVAKSIFLTAKKALEKQVPRKPVYGYDEQDCITCPICDYPLDTMDAGEYASNYKYCPECGQAIDWKLDWRK